MSRIALQNNTSRALAISLLTTGTLAASLGSIPNANASCVSFFGIGSGGQCTSTITSIAIAVGENAEAHAEGILGAAISFGDYASAATDSGALFNLAATFAERSSTRAGGVLSFAMAANSINQTVTAGTGNLVGGNIGNVAVSLTSPEATNIATGGIANFALNLAGSGDISGNGNGLVTANVVGLGVNLVNRGTFNNITNFTGTNTRISNTTNSIGNLGFNAVGIDNEVTSDGPFAVAGVLGSVNQTISQSGPGFNVRFNRQPTDAASTNLASPSTVGSHKPAGSRVGSIPTRTRQGSQK